jgi:hypothetical protein
MGKYSKLDGRAISKKAREDIMRAGTEMSLTVEWDHLPDEHRRRVMNERTTLVRTSRDEARADFRDWAASARSDAAKRLGAARVGTAAEESRRVAEEMRISRLVESARASGTSRAVAADLADKAWRRFGAFDYDEAMILARAADELGEKRTAVQEIITSVQQDRDLADPQRARAMQDLQDVAVVEAAFERDLQAGVSQAMQDASKLALALGDSVGSSRLLVDASDAGRSAKIAAAMASPAFGGSVPYVEPAGVVPGLPTNLGSVPDGARLPERKLEGGAS